MSGNFRFKRFAIKQENCAMKVGTDGVLLGAWCRIRPQDKALLNIGTGTGLIALMLAQRTEGTGTIIDAVEIDPKASEDALENFSGSEWPDRLNLHTMPIQNFATPPHNTPHFDHIVSNPPYFTGDLTPPDRARSAARHTATLSYEELIDVCDRLLQPEGRISLILPPPESLKMQEIASAHNFQTSRLTEVHSTPESGPKRVLLEFSRTQTAAQTTKATPLEHTTLTIAATAPGTFSSKYRALTRDFYLYF